MHTFHPELDLSHSRCLRIARVGNAKSALDLMADTTLICVTLSLTIMFGREISASSIQSQRLRQQTSQLWSTCFAKLEELPNQGDNPHECASICSDQRETSSKLHYVLSSRRGLDEEDVAEVDALVTKIQPDITFLVVQMMKSNANGSQPSLVTNLVPIVQWVTLLFLLEIE